MPKRRRESSYDGWIKEQGLPVVTGHGVEDVTELPRAPWPRLGGRGTFIKLEGMEGVTGMYVGEIPPGGALNPEKHLYEEFIYILSGRGAAEIEAPRSAKKSVFEWQTGSLFAPPLNTSHRLLNGSGSDPAIFLGFTNAPALFDIFHNPDFVLNNDYVFGERYDGRADFFAEGNRRYVDELDGGRQWDTNFVPDVRTAVADEREGKGSGLKLTQLEMSDQVMVTHIADWPVGRYQKAHHHGAGAVLLIVKGIGYSLMWPLEAGVRPYESGNADKVVRINWREGSVYSPPRAWFHQHFNTGPDRARQLALRYGSRKHNVEFHEVARMEGTLVSIREGGTLIEYADEDPRIRRDFADDCAKNGVTANMPEAVAAGAR